MDYALIPARAGSRGVGGKNLVRIGGRTLVARAIDRSMRAFGNAAVSSDSKSILDEAKAANAACKLLRRPASLATDTASMVSVVEHAIRKMRLRPDDVLVVTQPSSPFVLPGAMKVVAELAACAGSAFTASRFCGIVWEKREKTGELVVVNHKPGFVRRRQSRPAQMLESGGAYGVRVDWFLEHRALAGSNAEVVLVSHWEAVDVDDVDSLEMAVAVGHCEEILCV